MKRQKRLVWLCLALSPLVFGSCSDDDDDDLIGYWVRMSDFDGLARGEASGFTIGNKGYLACGFDGSKKNERMSDLWEYDMEMDAWMQKADFPGSARSKATAFSILRDISNTSDEEYDDDYSTVGCNLGGEQRAKVSLRTFPSGDGWGYEIRLEDKCLIYQSMIPAIDSLRPFPSEQSARRVGRLVLKRVVSGEPFAVTVKEVEDALKE